MTEVALHSVQNVHLHCQNLQTLPAINGQGLWGIRDRGEELHMYNRQTDRQHQESQCISSLAPPVSVLLIYFCFVFYFIYFCTPDWTALISTSSVLNQSLSETNESWSQRHVLCHMTTTSQQPPPRTHTDVIAMRPGGVLCSCLWWSDVPQRRR